MKAEKFDVMIDNACYSLVPVEDLAADAINHEVWKDGQLLFVINPGFTESDNPNWKVTDEYIKKDIDPKLIEQIGDALEEHYM